MNKCIVCKQESDGPICKHCLAENLQRVGEPIKKAAKFAVGTAFSVLIIGLAAKIKGKFKIL